MHTSPMVHNGFLVLAFLFFLFDGLRWANPRVSWTPLGFACVVGAFLFPFFL
jgi:hypothetical protein